MEAPRKNDKEMLEIKSTVIEMKTVCEKAVSSRLPMTDARITELEEITIATANTEKSKRKNIKKIKSTA